MSTTIGGVRIVDMPVLGTPTSSASVVGELAGSGRFQMNALRDYVFANNKGTHGFYTDLGPYGVVTYGADRLFVGAATMWNGSTTATDPTWMAAAFPGFGVYGQSTFASIDNFSMIAVSGATRSTNSRPTAQQVVIGGAFFANNEDTTHDTPVWAIYADARKMAGTGEAVAIESDIANLGVVIPCNPYNFEPVANTSNLWLGSGSGLTSGVNDANEAIAILANGAKYQHGILIANTALTGTDGSTGLGNAVSMANRQVLAWFNPAGNQVAQIYSTTATAANAQVLSFNDGGLTLTGVTGIASVIAPPTASCVSAVTLQGAAAGGTPSVGTYYNSGSGSMPLYLAPQGNGAVVAGGTVQPITDNTFACGVTGKRWTSVWATNGTIQTSDPALKTDIADLPTALPLVAAIHPKVFRWKDSPEQMVTRTTMDVPVKRKVTRTVQDHELQPNGSVHLVQRTIETEEDEVDLVPVTLPDGTPVMDRVPLPTPAGCPRRFEMRPRMHSMPRMQTVPKEGTSFVSRPGKRLHWGFLAPEVKAAFDEIGMDFGGYVRGEDGSHNLRPDQLIAVLWKAVAEMAEDFAAYKTAHP